MHVQVAVRICMCMSAHMYMCVRTHIPALPSSLSKLSPLSKTLLTFSRITPLTYRINTKPCLQQGGKPIITLTAEFLGTVINCGLVWLTKNAVLVRGKQRLRTASAVVKPMAKFESDSESTWFLWCQYQTILAAQSSRYTQHSHLSAQLLSEIV